MLFWKNKDVFRTRSEGTVTKTGIQNIFCFTGTKRVYQNLSVVEVFSFFSPCSQEQPKIIEPLDYEAEVFQRKAQIHNDPHRDLLLCPLDDVSVSTFIRSSRDCPRTSFTCGSSQQPHCWPAINPITTSLLGVKDITYHYTLEWLAELRLAFVWFLDMCLCVRHPWVWTGVADLPAEEDRCSLGASGCREGGEESVCQRGTVII